MPRIDPGFGQIIANIIDERGLSLRGVQYKTGIHSSTVSEMRKGVVPSRDMIYRLAEGLDIDPKPLLIAAGYVQPDSPVEAIKNVIVKYRVRGEITPEKEKRIMDYVREIIEEEDGLEEPEN